MMMYKIVNGLVDATPERPWLTPAPRQLRGHGQIYSEAPGPLLQDQHHERLIFSICNPTME